MLFLIDRNSFSHQTLQIYIKFFWKEKTVTGQEKPHNMHLVPVYDQKSSKNWDKLVSYLFQGYDFIERTLKCSWGPGTCSKIILELLSDVLFAYMYRGQIHMRFFPPTDKMFFVLFSYNLMFYVYFPSSCIYKLFTCQYQLCVCFVITISLFYA